MNEQQKQQIQTSETYLVGTILAAVGGFLDAYTYLCRGGVFANAQTGNIVLCGISFAEGKWLHSFYYFMPILAFFCGIICAEIIRKKYSLSKFHWRQPVIILEIIVLLITAFIPSGKLDALVNVLISFVCSLQVQSFRKLQGKVYATTMCTGNLRSATEALYTYFQTGEKSSRHSSLLYFGIIFFFIVGAIIGSVLTGFCGTFSIFAACLGLFIVFLLMFVKKRQNNQYR